MDLIRYLIDIEPGFYTHLEVSSEPDRSIDSTELSGESSECNLGDVGDLTVLVGLTILDLAGETCIDLAGVASLLLAVVASLVLAAAVFLDLEAAASLDWAALAS